MLQAGLRSGNAQVARRLGAIQRLMQTVLQFLGDGVGVLQRIAMVFAGFAEGGAGVVGHGRAPDEMCCTAQIIEAYGALDQHPAEDTHASVAILSHRAGQP